jgi:hypothetical protein
MQSATVAFAATPAARALFGGRLGTLVCPRTARRSQACATMASPAAAAPSWESLGQLVPQPDYVRDVGRHVQPTKIWEADRLPGTSQKADIRVIYYRDAAQWCL